MGSLIEFLSEEKTVPRYKFLVAGLIGAGCGAVAMLFMVYLGLVG